MLHQIRYASNLTFRKMMGLAFLMTRTRTPASLVTLAYTAVKLNIPKAPGIGLLLDQAVFESYNKNPRNQNEPISFEPYEKEREAFKQEWIYSKLMDQEVEMGFYEEWLRTVDSKSDSYSWWLNAQGTIQQDKQPKYFSKNDKEGQEEEEEAQLIKEQKEEE